MKARLAKNLVGTEIRRMRSQRDWSQERLAEECQDRGWNVSRGHIAKIEAGEVWVTDIDHLVLAAVFDVDMEDLMPRICVSVKRKKAKGSESLFVAINDHTGGHVKTIMSPDKILAYKSNKLLNGNGHGNGLNGNNGNGHEQMDMEFPPKANTKFRIL